MVFTQTLDATRPTCSYKSSCRIAIMRIHLSLDPKYLVQGAAGPSSGPLVNIGGDLVLIELQGELNHEGDKDGGVVGILGLDRPVSYPVLDQEELS